MEQKRNDKYGGGQRPGEKKSKRGRANCAGADPRAQGLWRKGILSGFCHR